MSKPTSRNSTAQPVPRGAAGSQRRVIVLVALVMVLTGTSALLLALAPAPPTAQASSNLFAIDAPQSFDLVFDAPIVPIETGHWQSIYVHHSATSSGDARSLAESDSGLPDHFVIGNGDGCADGEIQLCQRWTQQLPAGRIASARGLGQGCLSICVIGDFSRSRPTATQKRRLAQLICALQGRLGIPGSQVRFEVGDDLAGVGRYFPLREVRAQILP